MLNLIRVEVRKIFSQRLMAVLLVWLWPVGGIILPLLIVVLGFLTPSGAGETIQPTFQWTEVARGVWTVPTNLFGRLLFIALASAIFTGEYEWKTWANIVPRASRTKLVLAKYAAFTLLLILAITLLSILLTAGIGIIQAVLGLGYPPAPTSATIAGFSPVYLF